MTRQMNKVFLDGTDALAAMPRKYIAMLVCGLIVGSYGFGRLMCKTTSSSLFSIGSEMEISPVNLLRDVLPPVGKRDHIGAMLEKEGFTTGVELGVQNGDFALKTLRSWPSCTMYLLVDVWAPLENYGDYANKAQPVQDRIYLNALRKTEAFEKKRVICRNFTTVCAKQYQNHSFDYIYVDARHDYAGVMLDLIDWWPLVREGGIMAGHDFVTQNEINWTKQNWTINYDGTVDSQGRAVWGAVVEFFNNKSHPGRYRQITQTYQDGSWWTWMVRK